MVRLSVWILAILKVCISLVGNAYSVPCRLRDQKFLVWLVEVEYWENVVCTGPCLALSVE